MCGKAEHERCPDDRERVVHQQCREYPEAEDHKSEELPREMSVAEEPGGEPVEVPAPGERFPHDKHAEQKDHHVHVYCGKGNGGRDLAEKEDGYRSPEHDLPDPERKPSHLPYRDEAEDGSKDNDRNIRSGLFPDTGT